MAEIDETAVPEGTRPAMQAASRARQQVIEAAARARPDRRPAAEMSEVAVPLVNAVSYLVDAATDLQGQIAKLEETILQLADAGRLKA